MSAMFWQHETPYRPDAEAALRELQANISRDVGFDLSRLVRNRIADMAEAVRSCEQADPNNLLERHRDGLRRLREIEARGVPPEPAAGLALLKEIEAVDSDDVPGILALTGLSTAWEEWKARVLPPAEIEALFGTATPSEREVGEGVDRLAASLHPAMAACFPVYRDGRPESWCFIGSTGD
ncbi:hypothetical protein [Aquisphaera insulae]|uniref:hypothetical protein n=1 Tax=Aquisphaera insulae TaxID=2712864 RepID=UPI0013EC2C44|nr:hypothetical protein [Aquisphaera insulae]